MRPTTLTFRINGQQYCIETDAQLQSFIGATVETLAAILATLPRVPQDVPQSHAA